MDYWWYIIYQDIKNYYCPLCDKKPKNKIIKNKPILNQNMNIKNSNKVNNILKLENENWAQYPSVENLNL